MNLLILRLFRHARSTPTLDAHRMFLPQLEYVIVRNGCDKIFIHDSISKRSVAMELLLLSTI
jgi:hypothetical protein